MAKDNLSALLIEEYLFFFFDKKSENRFYRKKVNFQPFSVPNLVWKSISIGHGRSSNAFQSRI